MNVIFGIDRAVDLLGGNKRIGRNRAGCRIAQHEGSKPVTTFRMQRIAGREVAREIENATSARVLDIVKPKDEQVHPKLQGMTPANGADRRCKIVIIAVVVNVAASLGWTCSSYGLTISRT